MSQSGRSLCLPLSHSTCESKLNKKKKKKMDLHDLGEPPFVKNHTSAIYFKVVVYSKSIKLLKLNVAHLHPLLASHLSYYCLHSISEHKLKTK